MTERDMRGALEAVAHVFMFFYNLFGEIAFGTLRALYWLWTLTPWYWPTWAKLLVGYAVPFAAFALALFLFRRWRRPRQVHGKAGFAGLKEIAAAGMLERGGRFLGVFHERRRPFGWRAHDLFMHGEGHCLTIAAQGSGKTTGLIIPTLLEYTAGTVVVTDPKGAITAQTRRFRETVGRVVVLNPWRRELLNDPAFGVDLGDDGFNPLQAISTTPEGRAAASQLAALLLPDMPGESQPYFRQDGRDLLAWCLLWQAIVIKDPKKRSLPIVHGLVYDLPELARLLEAHSNDTSEAPGRRALRLGAAKFYGMHKTAPAQFTGVLGTLSTALSIYDRDSYLGQHVSAEKGFRLSDLKGADPLTLYLICPPGHLVGDDRKWLNLVLAMIAQEIGKPGLARETVLLMDEFPALGFLPNLAPALEQFREAGLRAHLIAQNPGQIVNAYSQDGLSRLWGACETKQFFRITDPNHAKMLSEWLGQKEMLAQAVNAKGEINQNPVGVPLIRQEELTGMANGRQVIMRPAMNPIWASVMPYYRRPEWAALVDPNPYRDGPPKPGRTAQPEAPLQLPQVIYLPPPRRDDEPERAGEGDAPAEEPQGTPEPAAPPAAPPAADVTPAETAAEPGVVAARDDKAPRKTVEEIAAEAIAAAKAAKVRKKRPEKRVSKGSTTTQGMGL